MWVQKEGLLMMINLTFVAWGWIGVIAVVLFFGTAKDHVQSMRQAKKWNRNLKKEIFWLRVQAWPLMALFGFTAIVCLFNAFGGKSTTWII